MQIVHFHSNKHGTSQIGWSVFVRRLASGILVTFVCCALMIVLRDPSVSLVEDDATSLEHVRNLLSTLDRTAVWNSISSTQASNPFIAAAPNVRFEQPVLIKALQNPLEQQSNAVQPKIEFLPTQPYAEPTSYAKSGTDSAFVFLPSPSNFPETEVLPLQSNFPGPQATVPGPQATVLPQQYLKSPFISNADPLSTGILPQAVDGSWAIPASRVLPRPILERHDLEEWLRLRDMTKSSLNVKALDAFSKSKQSVAQAFLASAQASQAAASASLGIKTGAAAAAAAASAAAAVEAEAAAAAEAGAEAGAGVSPANATLAAGSA